MARKKEHQTDKIYRPALDHDQVELIKGLLHGEKPKDKHQLKILQRKFDNIPHISQKIKDNQS